MRRFSQRTHLVTLSEINITPLLDLAFVLLIIFVITTPLLEQSIPLELPKGGTPPKAVSKNDVRVVDITSQGAYMLDRRRIALDQLLATLVRDAKANPNMVVDIRPDENGRVKEFAALLDGCRKNGITRFALRTEPEGTP